MKTLATSILLFPGRAFSYSINIWWNICIYVKTVLLGRYAVFLHNFFLFWGTLQRIYAEMEVVNTVISHSRQIVTANDIPTRQSFFSKEKISLKNELSFFKARGFFAPIRPTINRLIFLCMVNRLILAKHSTTTTALLPLLASWWIWF